MSLRSEYDAWHERVFQADPGHEDASSPWYRLVRETFWQAHGRSRARCLDPFARVFIFMWDG